MNSRAITLAARYIFPVEGPPVTNGAITFQEGKIRWLGLRDGRTIDRDFGNAAILPGLVNAHTHLELSPLDEASARGAATSTSVPTEEEIPWLLRVIQQRRQVSREELSERAAVHLREALAQGTTAIADITTAGASWSAMTQAPVRGIVYAEVIGLRRERGMDTLDNALQWIQSISPLTLSVRDCRPGLSPHAPYSTSGWVYERCAMANVPLCTHLLEMPEEWDLFRERDGKLRTFLETLGAWDDEWSPLGNRPADYLRRGRLRQCDWLAAHGNYLEPEDYWQFLPQSAPDGQRVALVYCPRTHARFGHAPHPYRALLQRGAVVCIGTDSLASAPNLSVLDEIRFLKHTDPEADGRTLLSMATIFGAWALRLEKKIGSLKPGKLADLCIVALPDRNPADSKSDADSDADADSDPHDLLLNSRTEVLATVFNGAVHLRTRSGEPSGRDESEITDPSS